MCVLCRVFSACICVQTSCNMNDVMMGCELANEFLCLEEKCCLGVASAFPVGVIKEDGFIFKLGLPCCTCGLKVPQVLCLGAAQCLCIKEAAAFPFKDPVPSPICAVCCLQCTPNVGCMKPAKKVGGAPDGPTSANMER